MAPSAGKRLPSKSACKALTRPVCETENANASTATHGARCRAFDSDDWRLSGFPSLVQQDLRRVFLASRKANMCQRVRTNRVLPDRFRVLRPRQRSEGCEPKTVPGVPNSSAGAREPACPCPDAKLPRRSRGRSMSARSMVFDVATACSPFTAMLSTGCRYSSCPPSSLASVTYSPHLLPTHPVRARGSHNASPVPDVRH